MHAAVRPYVTAGLALTTAGVIAVTPVAPPLPELQIPAEHVAVALTQFMNPITTWIDVLTQTGTNVVALAQRVAQFPIAAQGILNALANATILAAAGQAAGAAVLSGVQAIPGELQTAFGQLASGDIQDAIGTLFAIPLGILLGAGIALLPAVSTVATSAINNLAAAAGAAVSVTSLLELALVPLYPVINLEAAFASNAQDLFDAVTTGDFVTAASILINLPAVLTGAALNGFEGTAGALSTDFGTIANLLNIRDAIAEAIGAPPPPPVTLVKTAAPRASVSALAPANKVPAAVSAPTVTPPTTSGPVTTAPTTGPNTSKLVGLNLNLTPSQTGGTSTSSTSATTGAKSGAKQLSSAISNVAKSLTPAHSGKK